MSSWPSILALAPTCLALALLSGPARAQNAFADLVSTHAMTASDDYRIGSTYIELSGWLYGRVDDPEMVRRVEGITRKVVAVSDRPDLIVNVIVADVDEVNASAYPGGFLVVNRGAVELFDDDELTFVIAHELSHVLLRHYATTENLREATQTLTVAEKAMTATDRVEAEQAVGELQRMMARYDRQLEYEADLYGLLYTVRAGVPASAAQQAMVKLEGAVGDIPADVADVVGHPTFAERKSELQSGLAAMTETHRKFDVGLAGLSADLHDMAIEAFQQFLTLYPRSTAGWTNLAAAHLGKGLDNVSDDPWIDAVPVRVDNDVRLRGAADVHFDRARDACSKALRIDPNAPHCLVMLGVLARHEGAPKQAQELLSRAQSLRETPMLEVLIDRAVLEASRGRLDSARALLDQAAALEPSRGLEWLDGRLLANRALVSEKQGRTDAALADWQLLLDRGRFEARARRAIARLAPPPEESVPKPTTGEPVNGGASLGGLTLGMGPAAVAGVLGEPPVTESDDIGLNVYQVWPDRGVSVLFSADAVVGLECWTPCDLTLTTPLGEVAVGEAFEPAIAELGTPTELLTSPLFGQDHTAYYDRQGLTLHEMAGRVGRIALWER